MSTQTEPATLTINELDNLARRAMTPDEREEYARWCRWAVQPVGGPYHFLVASAAHTIDGGFAVWPTGEQYERAGAKVRERIGA